MCAAEHRLGGLRFRLNSAEDNYTGLRTIASREGFVSSCSVTSRQSPPVLSDASATEGEEDDSESLVIAAAGDEGLVVAEPAYAAAVGVADCAAAAADGVVAAAAAVGEFEERFVDGESASGLESVGGIAAEMVDESGGRSRYVKDAVGE